MKRKLACCHDQKFDEHKTRVILNYRPTVKTSATALVQWVKVETISQTKSFVHAKPISSSSFFTS